MTDKFAKVKVSIAEFQAQIKEMQKQKQKLIQEIGQEPFHEAFLELKKAVPYITRVHWNQYTPHWNDGDTCEFGVNEWCYDVEIDGEEHFAEDSYECFFKNLMTDKEMKEAEVEIAAQKEKYEELLNFYNTHVSPKSLPKAGYLSSQERWSYDGRSYWGRPSDSSFKYSESKLEEAKKINEKFSPAEIKKIKAAIAEFSGFMASVPEELYEGIFGDHVQIDITEDGIEVTDCTHD